jgi:outer membrane protein OmpA-like peptidoglycan-associated protein
MRWVLLVTALLVTGFVVADSVEESLFAKIDAAMTQARSDQMPLLAPLAWDKATQAYARARDNFEHNRAQSQIAKNVDEASAAIAGSTDAVRVARTTFEAALTSRSNAISAGADKIAPRTFARAEEQFQKAATTLERGGFAKAPSQAAEATESYRAAELESIKGAILRDAGHLLEQADDEDVDDYAPLTLTKARESYAEAERAIVEDRYDTDRARLLARQAKEQASHALHLTAQIKAVDHDERTFEAELLRAEAPIVDIANTLGVTPDLSNGAASTAPATLAAIKEVQRERARMRLELDERDERIATLETTLNGLTEETFTLNTLLAEQQERRDQLLQVEKLFNPAQAEVLRAGNSVVLRLIGLTFDSGSATIEQDDAILLIEVQKAIQIFNDALITVEGHTDSFGGDELNLELSQRRADAVRAYLLANMDLAAYRISALGYGETRPIANNETAEGRARNRRIDLVISRRGD